ncbi:hypothetical protein ACIA8O_13735 [Kitasatospora sp. NPDC051853]|uniref:hypothetical protein n=1 Tax=Kitasatospora sp. NPDC051853 TaxID=3364058 RepID=UPI00378D0633
MTIVKARPIPGPRPAPGTYEPLRITCRPGIPRRPHKPKPEGEPKPDDEPKPDEEPEGR